MSPFVCNPQPRRPVPAAGPSEDMQSVFDRGLNVAETIEMLDVFEWNAADLQWVIGNKKGKVQAWAKKEIKTAKEDPPN